MISGDIQFFYGYAVRVLQPIRVATHRWEFTTERVLLDGQLRYVLEKRATGHALRPHPLARRDRVTVDEVHRIIYCTAEQEQAIRQITRKEEECLSK